MYKVVYYDKNGKKREYGGMSAFLKKFIVGDVDGGKKEKEKKTDKDERKKYTYSLANYNPYILKSSLSLQIRALELNNVLV